MSDELPRDAHLRAALRHAPDRELAPPAALSRSILAAARAAVAPPPWPTRALAAVTALLDTLRRPAAGAAFASLVLATVIGLMWRDGPPPEADAPPARTVAAPQPARADERGVAAAPPAETAPAVAAADHAAPLAEARLPVPPPAQAAKTAPARAREARAPAAEPAIATAPAEADVHVSPAPPAPAAQRPATAPAVAQGHAADRRADAAPRAEAAAESAGVGLMQKSAAPARPVADPLARAIAALDASRDTTDTARQRSADGALAPRADPMRLWLTDLQRSTRGRWALADTTPSEPATALPGRDGQALGQLVIGTDAAWWQAAEPGAGWWRAPLPADELQRLRTGLSAWSAPR